MFNFFKKNKKPPRSLKEISKQLDEIVKEMDFLKEEMKELKEKNKLNLQKIGIVRYNPFSEVGGNQSFSIALLDENDNGIIITSHYLREFNRVYAKPIKNGKSEYSLTKEEKEAIEKAISNKISKLA